MSMRIRPAYVVGLLFLIAASSRGRPSWLSIPMLGLALLSKESAAVLVPLPRC